MTVLRSREVTPTVKPEASSKALENGVLEPATPSKSLENSTQPSSNMTPIYCSSANSSIRRVAPRRSVRLASKTGLSEAVEELGVNESHGIRIIACYEESIENVMKDIGKRIESLDVPGEGDIEFLSLRSGKTTSKRAIEESSVGETGRIQSVYDEKVSPGKPSDGSDCSISTKLGTPSYEPSIAKRRRFSREEKGKATVSVQDLSVVQSVEVKSEVKIEISIDDTVPQSACLPKTLDHPGQDDVKVATLPGDSSKIRRLNRGGKCKIVENPTDCTGSRPVNFSEDRVIQNVEQAADAYVRLTATSRGSRERFRNIAKQNASRFAHFSSQAEQEVNLSNEVAEQIPQVEVDTEEIEDWPGPFSTAMKIIRDREMNIKHQQQSSYSEKGKIDLVWVPKKDQQSRSTKLVVPSLQDLCMGILVKNADAVTSLECVPDALRHMICQSLCDSRKMTSKFLGLLAHGSPTEIRIRDCSWSSEDEFTQTFEGCDTSNLAVLQLDHCGRCMPDYILLATLARGPSNLPALTTLSLKGACRLSDAGLTGIISAAPCLRSINLSQCSLLTCDGISSLSKSLGSVLRELYLDDCEAVDPMLILPALLKLEHLEVLSVAGIQTVCDAFIKEFVNHQGKSLREIVLNGCMELTDCSVKEIAENCPGLCAIDLSNLRKLTDSALGHLATGCRAIGKLKLCHNAFSDEAVAAYVETGGESLKDLSLNRVSKVSHNTAMSLGKCSKKMISLDVSWCRNLSNEALGVIVDNCLSLEVLKLFGCTQVNNVFLDGHSNPQVQIIGLKMTPILQHIEAPESLQQGPLRYSAVP